MRAYLIDADLQDDDAKAATQEDLEDLIPDIEFVLMGSTRDAIGQPAPDILIIDIGTLAGPWPQPEMGVRMAEATFRDYQSAHCFAMSAVGGWADDGAEMLMDAGLVVHLLSGSKDEWELTFREHGLLLATKGGG